MIATYHNHSTWSDGKASVAELIAAARSMGVAALGISDHWVLHPQGKQFKWAMPTIVWLIMWASCARCANSRQRMADLR